MKLNFKKALTYASITAFLACASPARGETVYLKQLSPSILQPGLIEIVESDNKERIKEIRATKADIKEVFQAIGKISDLKINLEENVSGYPTFMLRDISAETALRTICQTCDLIYEKKDGIYFIKNSHYKPVFENQYLAPQPENGMIYPTPSSQNSSQFQSTNYVPQFQQSQPAQKTSLGLEQRYLAIIPVRNASVFDFAKWFGGVAISLGVKGQQGNQAGVQGYNLGANIPQQGIGQQGQGIQRGNSFGQQRQGQNNPLQIQGR